MVRHMITSGVCLRTFNQLCKLLRRSNLQKKDVVGKNADNNILQPTNTNLIAAVATDCGSSSGGDTQSNLKKSLFKSTNVKPITNNKITVVGCGQVGITIGAFLLEKHLTSELCLMDVREDWVKAEALDFEHAAVFLGSPKVITSSKDIRKTKDSKYIIITAGARPVKGNRLASLQKTTDILKSFVPQLVQQSPKAIYIVVSNPADVMTWVVQKLGKLPPSQCFSSGCHLDTARFHYYIAQRLQISPLSVNGFIIGEHGTSCVPVWSSTTVGGIPLSKLVPDIGTEKDKENWSEIHKQVVTGGSAVSSVKGYTNWAVALTVVDIIEIMEANNGKIVSVATNVKGLNGIKDDVVLSLPCALNSGGISQKLELPLTDWEKNMLKKSVNVLMEAQCDLKLDSSKS